MAVKAEDDEHVELDYGLIGQRDGRCSEVHSAEGHSSGMASIGRRLCAQVIE